MRIISYFKQESRSVNKTHAATILASKVVIEKIQKKALSKGFLLSFACCLLLSSCSQISLNKKRHSLLKSGSASQVSSSNNPGKSVNLSGSWRMGFRYQGKTGLASMELKQNNNNFSGSGKDEDTGSAFRVENGSINDKEIIFLKRYAGSPNQPVQYHGQFDYLKGNNGEVPYMGGDFSIETNGAVSVGEWEAVMNETKAPFGPVTMSVESDRKTDHVNQPSVQTERRPDLSGKWNVAYEYNFKIQHSVMFLEQNGNKLS